MDIGAVLYCFPSSKVTKKGGRREKSSRLQDSALFPAEQNKPNQNSSRSVLPFLIFCHHVLQTSRDDDDEGKKKKQQQHNKRQKKEKRVKNKTGQISELKNVIDGVSVGCDDRSTAKIKV